jgi:hypothetical protein
MPMIRPARPKVGHPGSMRRLPPSLRMAALLLLPVVWLGCAKDVPTAPEHSSESLAAGRNITGRILGPEQEYLPHGGGRHDDRVFAQSGV